MKTTLKHKRMNAPKKDDLKDVAKEETLGTTVKGKEAKKNQLMDEAVGKMDPVEVGKDEIVGEVNRLGAACPHADETLVPGEARHMVIEVLAVDVHVTDQPDVELVSLNEVEHPLVVLKSVAGFDDNHPGDPGAFCQFVVLCREVWLVEHLVVRGGPAHLLFPRGVVEVNVSVDKVLDGLDFRVGREHAEEQEGEKGEDGFHWFCGELLAGQARGGIGGVYSPVPPVQFSVWKGDAGRPSLLQRLGWAARCQAKRT